jgi:CO/xanthine dehydrogenase FAD-binding subunit
MTDMRYESPETLDAAVALLAGAGGGAHVLAGGTDVLVLMHSELIEPELLVDVKHIPEMRGITEKGGAYTVGAATPAMQILDHEGFAKTWPGVCEGVALIGSVQVKGRATMAGNLCNASPAADSVPAVIAAGATVTVVGPDGKRDVPVEEIITAPRKTSLKKGEFIVTFNFPARPANSGDCYLRLTPRTEMDIAVVGAGVSLSLDKDGTCTAARVSLGAVAPTPLLVKAAGDALVGTKVDDAALSKMAEACAAACNPISDKRGTKEYRIKTSGVIARRAAETALERAKGK